jgi:dipeptidase E
MIEEFLGSKPINIAFIPFADADKKYEEYAFAVRRALKNPALKINVVLPSNATTLIESCEAILVGGGNTFKLVHDLYELDLLKLIRAKIESGKPYIGWSAGSNILAPSISTTNDMPIVEPRSFKALGLFPFQINPHYFNKRIEGFNGETRDDRLAEFLKMNPAVSVVGLPEGSYLKFENNLLQYFGEEEGVLFSSANNEAGFLKKQLESEQDISLVLQP